MALTHKSPNYTEGRKGQKVLAIVLHISEGSLDSMTYWFKDPNSGVSAHYGVGRNGQVRSFVEEKNTAWHAGRVNKPTWRNMPGINPNLITIGIEHEGSYKSIWTTAQKKASAKLIKEICQRYGFSPNQDTVIGHYMIDSVRRPNCPAQNKGIINEIIKLATVV